MISTTMRRKGWAGLASASLLGSSTLIALSTGAVAGAALPSGSTFSFTGAPQSYQVPADVCQVTIEAVGAAGGIGGPSSRGTSSLAKAAVPVVAAAAAGKGGSASVTITVTPGESLGVYVGGRGQDGATFGEGDVLNHSDGGWNGGGDSDDSAVSGGGGGGASDVRQGGSGLGDRVVVAGGGGGSGGYSLASDAPNSIGGDGGNPATPGGNAPDKGEASTAAIGGGAGTESAGGAGGAGDAYAESPPIPGGAAGTLGQGGVGGGGTEDANGLAAGGGGGGGLYGGGGGGAGGESTAAGGGGGSSLGDTTQAGVNDGDGQVTITPSAECETPVTTTVVAPVAQPAVAVAAKPTYTG